MSTKIQTTRVRKASTVKSQVTSCRVIKQATSGKFRIVSAGTPFTREDGTPTLIFNVAAYDSQKSYRKALALCAHAEELTNKGLGESPEAQQMLLAALSLRMSFNIILPNIRQHEFLAAREISADVESVKCDPTKDKLSRSEKFVLQRVQPIELVAAGDAGSDADFADDTLLEEDINDILAKMKPVIVQ